MELIAQITQGLSENDGLLAQKPKCQSSQRKSEYKEGLAQESLSLSENDEQVTKN